MGSERKQIQRVATALIRNPAEFNAALERSLRLRGTASTGLAKLDAVGIDEVCAFIACGHSVHDIARELGIAAATVYRWLHETDDKTDRWMHAMAISADALADKAEDLLLSAPNPFELARAKEVANHLRWKARIYNPRRFSDAMDVNLKDASFKDDATLLKRINLLLLKAKAEEAEAREVNDNGAEHEEAGRSE